VRSRPYIHERRQHGRTDPTRDLTDRRSWATRFVSYGPLATAAGALVAAIAIAINGWRERRRKTLEACEKLVFDKELRSLVSLVYTAIENNRYERDTAERKAGSDRDDTSTIINVVETVALGVNLGMYDEEVARAYLTVYVRDLLAPYFLDPGSRQIGRASCRERV